MGDLLEERVNQRMVFENVGVDVAGPLFERFRMSLSRLMHSFLSA